MNRQVIDKPYKRLWKNIKKDRYLLVLVAPVIIYYFIFNYIPMYGAIIAFKDFSPGDSILFSKWVGLKWFREFFRSVYFGRLISNTFILSGLSLIFSFPVPIIFALLLNEVKRKHLKRVVQTVSYLPHFISLVVMVGIMSNFLSPSDGIINNFLRRLGMEPINFMGEPAWFRPLYIGSGIWQSFGWNSIIYMAALTSIDPQLYEAARIDGCNRWQEMRHITIPGLMPTAIMLLILALGNLMNVGFEKIILMYSPATYNVADVISTYVYRRGILSAQYSFGAAVGLFNSIINFILLITVNKISRRYTQIGLW
ncbi:MAG: ABC transporter permease subunit [Caldicoprobacterales bacterium]|mgnify:CR=1 FL=1|jgi:putative aldouronate transport system permease protein|nr:sugar ABC transporter permease [Clostridiales bacterium]